MDRHALSHWTRSALFHIALWLIGCGGAPVAQVAQTAPEAEPTAAVSEPEPEAVAPEGQLPEGVDPLRYRLSLRLDPRQDVFGGTVEIRARVAAPTRLVWMHGARLDVTRALVVTDAGELAATFVPSEREGIAALRTETPIPAGEVTLHLEYTAPFDRQLRGLYRVDVGDDRYAFTQFEATSARYAFPCFDEPRWKTPYEIEIATVGGDLAVANSAATGTEAIGEGWTRTRFAETAPLPTYLVALAAGPLEIVEAPPIPPNPIRTRPLPFRGIAARGRGAELRYALEHTPAIVAALESYFGTEYPWDKLDIVAVPDFASGAMENVGLVTFRDQLLLLSEDAPEDQVRAFTNVMAHELAHQWFGDLVTMPWWDDIWLNEAFATWMASRIVREVAPEQHAELGALGGVHGAMGMDSLAAARQIRQPIESDHDIRNAFDAITYQKGGGVISMFERWLGEDVFREGIRVYLAQHRFGTARSEDLLAALSEVSGRDVATPFRTFLEQPGVPLVSMNLLCDGGTAAVHVTQRRYLPVGSEADSAQVWSVPVCVRFDAGREVREHCELVSEAEATIALETERCPTWVVPNADAAGYYRFAISTEQLDALMTRGWARLTPRERLSIASGLRAAFAAGTIDGAAAMRAMTRIASDPTRQVATEPMTLAQQIVEDVAPPEQREAARAWAARLYRGRVARLGWTARAGEDGETALLRRDVLSFLVRVARDPATRREAARRGRMYVGFHVQPGPEGAFGAYSDGLHADAAAPEVAGIALSAALADAPEAERAPLFEAILAHFAASSDALVRARMLGALGAATDDALATRAMELGADPRLRVNEVLIPLMAQAETPEGRERAWRWAQTSFDRVFSRVASTRAGYAPYTFAGFCDAEHRAAVSSFFEPRIASLAGGPRNLRGALEAIALCEARVSAQRESVAAALR